jgi:hypothetical protein
VATSDSKDDALANKVELWSIQQFGMNADYSGLSHQLEQ